MSYTRCPTDNILNKINDGASAIDCLVPFLIHQFLCTFSSPSLLIENGNLTYFQNLDQCKAAWHVHKQVYIDRGSIQISLKQSGEGEEENLDDSAAKKKVSSIYSL